MSATNHLLESWALAEESFALVVTDRIARDGTSALRFFLAESAITHRDDADVWHAWGRLGQLLAELDGSPTCAAGSAHALATAAKHAGYTLTETWIAAAQGALIESYVSRRISVERARALGSWEYPACVVPLAPTEIAVAAGIPEEGDALTAWSDRVARRARAAGVRVAWIWGLEAAVAALDDAMAAVGIETRTGPR